MKNSRIGIFDEEETNTNQRLEAVERWARKVKEGNWKEEHTEFINSQFKKAEEVIKKLSETREGCEKIIKLYKIKNIKGYPGLLRKFK